MFLDPDRRPNLDDDAKQLLETLNNGADPEMLGDRTLTPGVYDVTPQGVLARDFGGEFASEVVALPVGDWRGPLYSPFGAHLIKIEAQVASRLPGLAEIRDEVLREYLAEKRAQQKNVAYARLREEYEVTVDPLDATATRALSKTLAAEAD